MGHFLSIAGLAFLLCLSDTAVACSQKPPEFGFASYLHDLSTDQIPLVLPEVVVEGVIEGEAKEAAPLFPFTYDGMTVYAVPQAATAKMRVEHVWKGKFTEPTVTVWFSTGEADCSRPPPLGERIRIGGPLVSEDAFFYGGYLRLLFDDPAIDKALRDYRDRSDTLEAAAEVGGRTEHLAFGEHLFRNDEWHRAEAVYQALLNADPKDLDALVKMAVIRTELERKSEPENTLRELRRFAPPTEEWHGKIARPTYATTGKFEPGWLDWSNLEYARLCEPGNADLRGANFDGAHFPKRCNFEAAQLQGASFRGVDLREVYLSDPNAGFPNIKGAKFDCGTRFSPFIDPVAGGMTNVDGSCPAVAP
jgi:hypothetical protein